MNARNAKLAEKSPIEDSVWWSFCRGGFSDMTTRRREKKSPKQITKKHNFHNEGSNLDGAFLSKSEPSLRKSKKIKT
jgi:hypothetical protein